MPRMLPRARPADEDIDPNLLAAFCALLLDALQIPEIRAAITDTVHATEPDTPPVVLPPVRGQTTGPPPRRRGQR